MITLTDEQVASLQIEQLIFHVVQHEEDEPILLDETPIKGFEAFFLERVKETFSGNHFEFSQGSSTLHLLKDISSSPQKNKFVENSKQLAIDFHAQRDKRIKPGAIILIRLTVQDREFFSILKYDREQVIAFNLIGDAHAVLQEIVNSFTSSKNALQKSALIELTDTGGDLIVNDRTVSYDITDFFRGFLNVKRNQQESEMTQSVYEATIQTTIKHKSDLPKGLTEKMREISFHAIQELVAFNEDEYFDKVFGPAGNPKIRKTFTGNLRRAGIDGATFKFIKDSIKPPRIKKYSTNEGLKITYGPGAEDTITIDYGKQNEKTTIIIKTDKLIEE